MTLDLMVGVECGMKEMFSQIGNNVKSQSTNQENLSKQLEQCKAQVQIFETLQCNCGAHN